MRRRERGRYQGHAGRSGSPAGSEERPRDSRQRLQGSPGIAHRPASEYRQRLYWIRRVSPHPPASAAPLQSIYFRNADGRWLGQERSRHPQDSMDETAHDIQTDPTRYDDNQIELKWHERWN